MNTSISPSRQLFQASSQTVIDPSQAKGLVGSPAQTTSAKITEPPLQQSTQQRGTLHTYPLRSEWGIFASTFITIFLAELGDKTQMTTLLMSAGARSPWIVFAGAAAALVLTSLMGVLLGRWLSTRICPRSLETAVSGLFLLISVMLLWDVIHL